MSTTSSRTPRFSVVIPTFRRPGMLARAVESVRRQTFEDWELIISDDERVPGRAWRRMRALARDDGRIRPVRNEGGPGQVGNMNSAMRHARGEWIKPLYDDDALLPHCLERLSEGLRRARSASLACALAMHYRDGALVRSERRAWRAPLELMAGRRAILAMYLQDVEIGIPTQVAARRACVADGTILRSVPGMETSVDQCWYADLLERGDLLLVNEPLVERRQGRHATVTSRTTDDALYREFARLRERLLPRIDPALRPPPLSAVHGMLGLIRAARELAVRRSIRGALVAASGVRDPRAAALFLRWATRRAAPGATAIVPRTRLRPGAQGRALGGPSLGRRENAVSA